MKVWLCPACSMINITNNNTAHAENGKFFALFKTKRKNILKNYNTDFGSCLKKKELLSIDAVKFIFHCGLKL
jgi:hypothetical protein